MEARDQDVVNGVVGAVERERSNPASVLVAGSCGGVISLSTVLTEEGFAVTHVTDGVAALECLRRDRFDVALLERELPGTDGAEVCRLARRDQGTRLLPLVLLLPDCGSHGERLEGIEAGADQIVTMPIDVGELMARLCLLVRQKRYTDDFEQAASVMTTLSAIIETRERYAEGHCHRMANQAAALGRRMRLGPEDTHVLRRGAFLHDIGMLAIPDVVLLKPGKLSATEQALIQSHTVIGESLIANLRSLQPIRCIVRYHHERRDGSGYPDGLEGDDIPLSAQIVGMVETFEAMISPRPYRQTASPKEALRVLRHQTKEGWHREDVFDAFASMTAA